jgi:surfactin synthase thioesterase subunit
MGRAIVAAFVLIVGVGAGAGLWHDHRDALTSLPRPEHGLEINRTALAYRDRRHVEHIIFKTAALGEIGIVVSLPNPLPERKLPLLLVLGGLGTGEDNIRDLPDAGDNAIVGYDWPIPVRFDGYGPLTHTLGLYQNVMAIPAQVASAVDFLAAQPWADDRRISLLGYSLGALAAPAIEDVAEHDGKNIGWTILAYGGAPFGELVTANPHIKPGWVRPILASLVNVLFQPLQPTEHLAHLSGQFLILEGHDDSLIPETPRARLREAAPEPKTIVAFEGNHMGVGGGKAALLQRIIAASAAWQVEKGAVNPL